MEKRILSLLLVALFFYFASGSVLAQDKYPEKPIQSVIVYGPGGFADFSSRLMADFLAKYLGQPVISVNKAGAGGTIGTTALVNSKPDGYTIGQLTPTQVNPENLIYFRKSSYTLKDLQHVANWTAFDVILCVSSDSPWKSLKDFVEYAKKNPGKIKYGNSGTGNRYWTMGVSLAREAGINIKDVPFQGDGETMTALLGNHIDMGVIGYVTAKPHLQAMKIRALCLFTTGERIEELPDVPTIKELGYTHTLGRVYYGTFVPSGTPANIVSKLSKAIRKVTEDVEYRDKCKQLGTPIWYIDTKDFEEYNAKDSEQLKKLFKEMGYL